jgi:hypothetical protein
MTHCGDTPNGDEDGEPCKGADPVNNEPGQYLANRIGDLKRRNDISIIRFVPVQRFLQFGRQDPAGLAIDIIDGGSEEQKSTNRPPVDTSTLLNRRIRFNRFGFHLGGTKTAATLIGGVERVKGGKR